MSHYFTNDKVKSNEKEVDVIIKDTKLRFIVDNGVFSKKGLDFGTRSLLESLDLDELKGDILDFGCGYGPIGIYIKKTTNTNVDMIDINERAIKLAEKNSKLNKVEVNIFKNDRYINLDKKYDFIITNPPIRVGKKVLYEILFESLNHLKDGGKLYLVINKNQGAKTTLRDLNEKAKASIKNKNKDFYIIEAQNRWQLSKKPL